MFSRKIEGNHGTEGVVPAGWRDQNELEERLGLPWKSGVFRAASKRITTKPFSASAELRLASSNPAHLWRP